MDLKTKTYFALFWSLIDRAGEQTLRFIFSIVMARILLPKDFGLLGMAYVVTEISRIFVQGGFGKALINKNDATVTDECSVFYFNIFLGIIAVITIYFLSPQIGLFFKNAELVPICRILSLNVLIGSTATLQTVLMTKKVDFKSQTKVGIPATLLSGSIGILLAMNNLGVWSLVIQTLLRSTFYSIFMWSIHSWRPKFLFSFRSINNLFGFGSKVLFSNIILVIFDNIYIILIGKFFSPVQLGYYTRARQTQQLPIGTLWTIIGRVIFPVFSSIKNENDRLRKAVSSASINIAFFVFPSLLFGAIIAPDLFHLLFGEKWMESVWMFQILCISTVFSLTEQLYHNVILSKGKSGLQCILQFIKHASTLLTILITYRFGIKNLLLGFGVVSYLNFFLSSVLVEREIGYRCLKQVTDLLPTIICTIASGVGIYVVSTFFDGTSVLKLSIQLLVGSGQYLILCHLMGIRVLHNNINLMKHILHKKPLNS